MGTTRQSVFALAAGVVLAACGGGDAADQTMPDDAAPTPAEQPAADTPAVGADVELPAGVTPEMVAEGEQIFNQQICFTCHGVNGVGTPLGPSQVDQEWLNTDGSYEGIIDIVRTGVATPVQFPAPMPPMGGLQLTDDQIRAVSAYVYTLSHGG